MATPPVTLDLSKMQPINSAPASSAPANSGVQLDFSKFEPVNARSPAAAPVDQEVEASKNRMEMLSGMTGMPVPGQDKAEFERGKTAGMVSGLATVPIVAGATAAASAAAGAIPELFDAETAGTRFLQKGIELGKAVIDHVHEPGAILKFPFGRAVEYYMMTKLGLTAKHVNDVAAMMPK